MVELSHSFEDTAVRCVLLLLLLLLLLGCNKSHSPSGGATPSVDAGPLQVKVASPKKQTANAIVEQPATIMPYEVTPLVAKLPGYVGTIETDARAKRPIDIGSEVKAGQLLATIAIPELNAKLAERLAVHEQAEAELAAAQGELKVYDAFVQEAEAKVSEARAGVDRARAEVSRWTTQLAYEDELLKKMTLDPESRNVTLKHLDTAKALQGEAEARVGSATAVVEERRARRRRGDADVRAAIARVRVADSQVKVVKADLSYTEIRAPFDGIVTTRDVHSGHFVQPGVVLFTVAAVHRLRITVDVPESSAVRALPGAAVVVRVPALNNREFAEGVSITRTSGVIQPETRTLRTEIEIDNADGAIKPGMYAFATIKGDSVEAMVLPAACILAADETHYIYLIEGGKALKYRVRVGRTEGGTTQVLDRRRATATSGNWVTFSGSESAVVGNLGALTDGAAVEAKPE